MALDDEYVRDIPSLAPGNRPLCRKRAPPRDDDDVRLGVRERVRDARSHGVVVVQHALRPGHAQPTQEDGVVGEIDGPRAVGDGGRGVDDGEVELWECRKPVEERPTVRRGLGEDGSNAQGIDPLLVAERTHPALGASPQRSVVRDASGTRGARPYGDGHVQLERRLQERRPCAARLHRASENGTRRGSANLFARRWMTHLERMDELDEARHGPLDAFVRNRLTDPDLPREIHVSRGKVWSHRSDLAAGDLELERALNASPPLRRLPGMNAVEDERRCLVRPLARP